MNTVDGRFTPLSVDEIAVLRQVCSPTIANAVETFQVRPRTQGVTSSGVCCLFPEFGAMVGYACTAAIISDEPAPEKRKASRMDYWRYTLETRGPKVTVVQDLSVRPGGAYWGEVNANIHRTLGSVGVLTNGTVRDLDEVRPSNFHLFASGVSVSHGYAHLEDFNLPVEVFGMTVQPGDLVHADKHGAVVIPHEIAHEVIAAVRKIEEAEKVILSLCRSNDFSLAQLDKLISPEY